MGASNLIQKLLLNALLSGDSNNAQNSDNSHHDEGNGVHCDTGIDYGFLIVGNAYSLLSLNHLETQMAAALLTINTGKIILVSSLITNISIALFCYDILNIVGNVLKSNSVAVLDFNGSFCGVRTFATPFGLPAE